MRPQTLRFQCFGPYKKEMFVDFEKLEKNGLFLIYGETGAGKTTILDAICYALYGKSSGGSRGDISVMRCKLAEPSDETFVEFTFSIGEKCYRFERRLRFGRKNLMDFHNCMIQKDGEFVPIFENPKIKNVNQKAEEIIGLSYEQFRQVIILPQGQFEKLLISNSEEKEKILVSLFKAEKWQKIAEEMYRRVAEQDKELREEAAAMKSKLAEHHCETLEDLEVMGEEQKRQTEDLKIQTAEAEEAEAKQRKEYEEAQLLKEQFRNLHQRQRTAEQLEQEQEKMKALEQRVTRAEEAEHIRPFYESYCTVKKNVESGRRKSAEAERKLAEAAEVLSKIRQKIAAHEAGQPAYEEGVRRLNLLDSRKDIYRILEQREKEAKEAVRQLEAEMRLAEQEKAGYEKKHKEWLAAMDVQKAKIESYSQAQQRYLGGISGTLAQQLKHGEPCPVCGSCTHPNPAKLCEEHITEQELDALQKEMIKAGRVVEKSAKDRERAEHSYQERQQSVTAAEQKAWTLQSALEENKKQKIDGVDTIRQLETESENLRQRIEKYKELTVKFQQILTDAISGEKAAQEALENLCEEQKILEEDLVAKKKCWEEKCREMAFDSEESYAKSLMESQQKNQKKEQILRFQSELRTAWKTVEELKEKLDGQQEPDLENQKQELLILEQHHKEITRKYILAQQTAEKMQQDVENLQSRGEKHAEKRIQVDADLDFANHLRGRTGISLQRYVLGVMLSSVTVEANRLLKNVHGGRYQLFRTNTIAGASHKGGLELEVLDGQSNERRSVTTLSGGEKFLVALSLAIGLSAVVQAQGSGMKMEAMFIDEGFGSLDQNSVYDALEVLQSIRRANGIVGIISHVDLLQEVITDKIEVKKGKQGSELLFLS